MKIFLKLRQTFAQIRLENFVDSLNFLFSFIKIIIETRQGSGTLALRYARVLVVVLISCL